jgi:hypothetical protein
MTKSSFREALTGGTAKQMFRDPRFKRALVEL